MEGAKGECVRAGTDWAARGGGSRQRLPALGRCESGDAVFKGVFSAVSAASRFQLRGRATQKRVARPAQTVLRNHRHLGAARAVMRCSKERFSAVSAASRFQLRGPGDPKEGCPDPQTVLRNHWLLRGRWWHMVPSCCCASPPSTNAEDAHGKGSSTCLLLQQQQRQRSRLMVLVVAVTTTQLCGDAIIVLHSNNSSRAAAAAEAGSSQSRPSHSHLYRSFDCQLLGKHRVHRSHQRMCAQQR